MFSEPLAREGQPGVPRFVEPALSPASPVAATFPLVLTSAKVVHYCHGQHRHVPSLRRRAPDPLVAIHPETAAARGIDDGAWVEIATTNGTVRMRARFDRALDPRVVAAQYGWWQDNAALGLPGYDALGGHGSNYNTLISDRVADPVSGSTGLRSSLCEVRPLPAA